MPFYWDLLTLFTKLTRIQKYILLNFDQVITRKSFDMKEYDAALKCYTFESLTLYQHWFRKRITKVGAQLYLLKSKYNAIKIFASLNRESLKWHSPLFAGKLKGFSTLYGGAVASQQSFNLLDQLISILLFAQFVKIKFVVCKLQRNHLCFLKVLLSSFWQPVIKYLIK